MTENFFIIELTLTEEGKALIETISELLWESPETVLSKSMNMCISHWAILLDDFKKSNGDINILEAKYKKH